MLSPNRQKSIKNNKNGDQMHFYLLKLPYKILKWRRLIVFGDQSFTLANPIH
jgi:hypothetical protein